MSLTKVSFSMISSTPVSILDYGALANDTADCTPAFTAALAASNYVYVPSGSYAVGATIEIAEGKTIELAAGARITKKSALTASQTPVFWLKGNFAGLIGKGQRVSIIATENKAPDGIVKIGHISTVNTGGENVLSCTLSDLQINGYESGGHAFAPYSYCVHVVNAEADGKASYFHSIRNLHLANANSGIWLHGPANANNITGITGNEICNSASAADALLQVSGASDNRISNFFFNAQPHANFMRFTNENTISGTWSPDVNHLSGMIAEISGTGKWLIAEDTNCAGQSNYIQGIDNVAAGSTIGPVFANSNIIITRETATIPSIVTNAVKFRASPTYSADPNTLDDYEENSWVPDIDSVTTPGTGRTTQVLSATYVKIGRRVFFDCYVKLTVLGTGGTGGLCINGLPFTSAAGGGAYVSTVSVGFFDNLASTLTFMTGTVQPNSNTVLLRGLASAASVISNLQFSTYAQANTEIILSGHYLAAQ